MPDAGGHLMGDPDDFRRMLEAFDERNRLAEQHSTSMTELAERVTELTLQIEVLHTDLSRRPTKRELAHRRRTFAAGVALLVLAAFHLADLNTEHCGPGVRSARAVDALARGERDPDVLADAGRTPTSPWCDTLIPTHRHADQPFPNGWSVLGWVLYAAGAIGVSSYARGPRTKTAPVGDADWERR